MSFKEKVYAWRTDSQRMPDEGLQLRLAKNAKLKLEIVFMTHYASNHLLSHEDGALLAILLIILNQLTKYEVSIYIFVDIPFTSFQWLNLQRTITLKSKLTLF